MSKFLKCTTLILLDVMEWLHWLWLESKDIFTVVFMLIWPVIAVAFIWPPAIAPKDGREMLFMVGMWLLQTIIFFGVPAYRRKCKLLEEEGKLQ